MLIYASPDTHISASWAACNLICELRLVIKRKKSPKKLIHMMMLVKISTLRLMIKRKKNLAHSKVGSVGSQEMTFFGILKFDPLEPCGNVFLFLPPSIGRKVVVTVCTGTDSQTACRLKLISAGFQWTNFQNSKKCHLL